LRGTRRRGDDGRRKLRYTAGNDTASTGSIAMQFRISPKSLNECSAEEWQARVDLAAAHRLAFNQGFSEGIFNHLTLVVPGRSDRYYQIPFGMHWSEVTASSFMEVGIDDGKVKQGEGDVERSCYCIHAPIHKALPQAKAVFHTHMPYASALTRLEDPRIKTEVGMSGKIAYDDEYTGPAFDPAEGERLAKVIGDKTILFMANHGISTVGETIADAYDRLYYIERAAQVQIYAMWTQQPLKKLPDAVVEKTKQEMGGSSLYDGPTPAQRHFDALKRMLDKKEPDYAS
jgi:ribulose-5-phosphate 4-epimerase/fuculose-1-phosphate aldolase